MPSRQYNLVQSDDLDTRVPLLPEEAFQHGIQFNCKFIGSMDIPRPTSRVEIVAAMRRVRFDFKQKGIKKKKVTVTVSVNGIKTTLRKRNGKKKRRIGRKKDVYVDNSNALLIQSHPIYRIFYVSHDSQDVKIFSYIARDTSANVFRCCVFKATKKAQAMRIVRTVGQAFEVCHKLVSPANNGDDNDEEGYPSLKDPNKVDTPTSPMIKSLEQRAAGAAHKAHKIFSKLARRSSASEHSHSTDGSRGVSGGQQDATKDNSKLVESSREDLGVHVNGGETKAKVPAENSNSPAQDNTKEEEEEEYLVNLAPTPTQTPTSLNNDVDTHTHAATLPHNKKKGPPIPQPQHFNFGSQNDIWLLQQQQQSANMMGAIHEAHLLREKLEQQQQQTQAALAQINLLRDQLAAESAARIEAQARTHQLLLHNKELLDHLQSLVRHVQELEGKLNNSGGSSMSNSPAPALPQLTPRSKIERWFLYAALMEEDDGRRNPSEEELMEEDELLFLKGVEEDEFFSPSPSGHLRGNAKVKASKSKRTLVSKGESGFVSENTLNYSGGGGSKYFDFKSSSSIFRRMMLRLGSSSRREQVDYQKVPRKNRIRRNRRARRAELEAAIMRGGGGIGNKSFIGSTSSVHFRRNNGNNNSSQKSKVSSL